MRKAQKTVTHARHRHAGVFTDHRHDRYRRVPASYARARHRAYGPPNAPTIYDMTPDEFTSAKGVGPRY